MGERERKEVGSNKGKKTESREEGVEKVGWLYTVGMDRWIGGQTDRHRDRQKNKQLDRQRE